MGAHQIKRDRLKEANRTLRRMKQRGRINPASVCVTVIQDEVTKKVLGVAVDRVIAAKQCEKNGWNTGELIDFRIEV